ncbi:MAG: hypothetical protein AMJ53_05230 [Gammaproteobacteria bacterium SG8_11]|nr:MAG: hypothetical protein AMJ53_05230 [Gammaproteobacteria bacterium SG8_11]
MKTFLNKKRLTDNIAVLALAFFVPVMISSCDVSNSSTPVFKEERLICEYLTKAYKNKDLTFEYVVANFDNFAVKHFCKKDGFHIPKEGEEVKLPRPLPVIMAEITKGKKIDQCKRYGYDNSTLESDQQICACIRSGKSKRQCVHLYQKHESEQLEKSL